MRPAKPIQEGEQKNREAGTDERTNEQVQVEERGVPVKQRALRSSQDKLVKVEEDKDQAETADGMFGIDSDTDRRSEVTDESLGNAVETDWIVVTQSVLENADYGPEQKARGRIAATDPKINCDEQRQLD